MKPIYGAMSLAIVSCDGAGRSAGEKTETPSPGLSVVVPCYRSAATLPELVERLGRVLPGLAERHEVILVNDGSGDGTWEAIRSLAERHEWVRGLNLMRNYGQHNAVLCGIREARFGRTVTMDDDLQHPPEELPRLAVALTDDYDVVYGTPQRQQHGTARDLGSMATKFALRAAMGVSTAEMASAWRIFRTGLREAFVGYRSPYVSIDVLLSWGTRRFQAVALRHEPRACGVSNYTLGKLVWHAFNMLTGFSSAPLRLASLVGFVFTVFGGLVLAYVLGRYFVEGSSVAGFPFLASIIAIFSGAQLFALGIIGEYIARMHGNLMERPAYVVADKTGGGLV